MGLKILPRLVIGNVRPRFPIIQGGMAVKVSTGKLAGAVAREGGIGLIAGSGLTDIEIREEIRIARKIAEGGYVGINTLVAASRFIDVMRTAVDEGIDLLVAGAGFSRDLLALGKKANVPVVPIVSSAKLAVLAESLGATAVVVEGKEAGGHLGTTKSSRFLYPLVKQAVKIPVLIAGGITDREDLMEVLAMKVDGVQVGTRFAASEECNAADSFKKRYLEAKQGDVFKIHSPVGLPGNALSTPFSDRAIAGGAHPEVCNSCLKRCSRSFCIVNALLKAREGDLDNGLVFAGEHVYKIKEVLPVKEIFRLFFDGLEPVEE
ncbi:MAG: nitronate monooxygenase [Candidatus Riflebacteria bacterium]|nr:nitronate monooxygenase [Candidatus Riflebacteria bacterium]